ncbi:MAG TPA: hypothetical protein VD996_11475 [Chitinophagaceae bacterium]|nr:hypothetical protein [Chitinophagaceae bacterium]
MKEDQDYIRDIAEMRSLMERSSKFMSLSGLAAILVGIYALAGAGTAYFVLDFNPQQLIDTNLQAGTITPNLRNVIILAIITLVLGISTAIILSNKQALKRGIRPWNPTTRRLMINMAVPLIIGGLLILVLLSKGFVGLAAPFTLIFYGLAFYNASKYTYEEVRSLGLILAVLGLIGSWFVEYGVMLWALGFGVVHIIYGIYIHYRHER